LHTIPKLIKIKSCQTKRGKPEAPTQWGDFEVEQDLTQKNKSYKFILNLFITFDHHFLHIKKSNEFPQILENTVKFSFSERDKDFVLKD
jgi:hypothetical protein